MSRRTPSDRAKRSRIAVFVLCAASAGCGLSWDALSGDDDAAADSVELSVPAAGPPGTLLVQPVADTISDTVSTSSPEVVPAVESDSLPPDSVVADQVVEAVDTVVAAPDSVDARAEPSPNAGLESRLDLLISSQVETNRRLDALDVRLAEADTIAGGGTLTEARDQVRGFGVGIAWSVLVIILFNLAIRSVVWVLDALAERNASRRLFYKRLVPIVRIVLWVFAAYLIVRVIFQVDAQGIVAAAAAVGVAVGFAAQDLLKNLFGGLILVFDQPFQVGDKISVGGTYGEVVSIGLRSTRMVTADDNLVSVPNAMVVDQQVANANAGELNCQVVTDLYLPGWADEDLAMRIAFQAAASSKYVYQKKPIVTLVSDVFKETFLTRVRVKAYVLDPRLEFQFQSDVTERARAGFREAGLLTPDHVRWDLVRHAADSPAAGTGDSDDIE